MTLYDPLTDALYVSLYFFSDGGSGEYSSMIFCDLEGGIFIRYFSEN